MNRAEADLLRGILGPAKPRDTSLRQASLAYRRRQRRAQMTRGLIVLALIGSVGGSAFIFSKTTLPAVLRGRAAAAPQGDRHQPLKARDTARQRAVPARPLRRRRSMALRPTVILSAMSSARRHRTPRRSRTKPRALKIAAPRGEWSPSQVSRSGSPRSCAPAAARCNRGYSPSHRSPLGRAITPRVGGAPAFGPPLAGWRGPRLTQCRCRPVVRLPPRTAPRDAGHGLPAASTGGRSPSSSKAAQAITARRGPGRLVGWPHSAPSPRCKVNWRGTSCVRG